MNNRTRAALVAAHEKALEKGKAAYQRAEDIFAKLMKGTPVGTPINLPKGGQVAIVDQFAESNSAFKAARVSRFVLKPVKATAVRPKALIIERPMRAAAAAVDGDEIPM